MPIHNSDVAKIFNKFADLLEIRGENVFRIRAYRNASRIILSLPKKVSDMVREGQDLTQLTGIGTDLASKIKEIVETGKLSSLERIEKQMPPGLNRLLDIQGLGPKRVKALYEKLKIKDIEGLREAVRKRKVRRLEGFGLKTEENILREIERVRGAEGKFRIDEAEEFGLTLVEYLKKIKGVRRVIIGGSYRRGKEVVGDLDILATVGQNSKVMERFVGYEESGKVISHGQTRSTIILRSGLQVDLRVVPEKSYGAALVYFTGSQAHNVAIRKLAVKNNLKINEYGVYRLGKSNKEAWIAGETEESVYKAVGLTYIEPELRENRGEIEAAEKGKLPRLITLKDIRGDLHAHTKVTDGQNSLQEMAEAARDKGYSYIAITEHSKRVTVAHGLDSRALLKRIKEIDRFNEKAKGITVLKGVEVDILEDGSLDLEDGILKELDLRVCAMHSRFNLSSSKQTERVIRAMDNPYFNVFAHPTGRLINERNPYDIDMEKVMLAAKERGCILEQNSHPMRLDLNDIHCRMAKEIGVRIAISTDAHSVIGLGLMRFGVLQARRGWIEADDVINTRQLSGLKQLLKRK